MKKTAFFQTIVLLIMLCLAAPLSSAYAEIQGVATVVALRGTVVAQGKGGAARNLSLKSQIFQEDVLKTDKTGQLQIMFTDNSIISLGRDSEMKIAEYRWQPEQKDGALRTQVKEGTFRVMGGALAKEAPQNFKTETPTATIGIRGSMYTFVATKDSLSVLFQGGKGIEIFNDLGKVTITVPGFGTHVLLNAPPARPSKFTEQELNNLNRGLNGNGGSSGSGGPPLSDTNQAPKPPIPPVLPPTNEFPTAPDFTLPPPPPSDGIYAFEGTIGGVSTGLISPYVGITDTFINNMSMGVNWHNHRIFGVAYDNQNNNNVFFFGSVNGSTVTDLTILGIDTYGQNYDPGVISGSGMGVFAGTAYDFFAFAATGSTALIKNLAQPHDTWLAAGGGQQTPGVINPVSPTGTETWKGFAVGTSVDLAAPYSSSVAMYQSAPNDFSMTVNKDIGTISGTLTPGVELQTSFDTISGLVIGHATDLTKSVYLRDDLIAALFNPVGGSHTLKPYGNFMVVADPSEQFSSYVTWGYWQIAYTDTYDGTTERLMTAPYSLWIAGNPTSNIDMAALNGYKGTYNGNAIGTEISTNGAKSSISGTCVLNADFTNGWVDGNIILPGTTLPFSSVPITTNSFTGNISNGSNISGQIKGGFFGPAAIAVGGNFNATKTGQTMPDTKQYLGIFGGNRGALTTSSPN